MTNQGNPQTYPTTLLNIPIQVDSIGHELHEKYGMVVQFDMLGKNHVGLVHSEGNFWTIPASSLKLVQAQSSEQREASPEDIGKDRCDDEADTSQ